VTPIQPTINLGDTGEPVCNLRVALLLLLENGALKPSAELPAEVLKKLWEGVRAEQVNKSPYDAAASQVVLWLSVQHGLGAQFGGQVEVKTAELLNRLLREYGGRVKPVAFAVKGRVLRGDNARCFTALVLPVLMLVACQSPQVSGGSNDVTPPAIRWSSIDLAPDLVVGQSIAQSNPATPSQTEHVSTLPSATRRAVVWLRAEDTQSGVRDVHLEGELRSWCIPAWGSTLPPTMVRTSLAPSGATSTPSSSGTLPASLSTSFTLDRNALSASCPGQTVADFEWVFAGRAINGAGLSISATSVRVVRPATVLVVNAWGPCLEKLEQQGTRPLNGDLLCDGLHAEQPAVGPNLTHLDEQLGRWARYFAQHDIVLLNEMPQAHWLARIQLGMPAHFAAHRGTTAVLSRWPISRVAHDVSAPFCCPLAVSEHTMAQVETPRGSMDLYSVHWAHRPLPVTSSPQRIAFAQLATHRVLAAPLGRWVLMGGDFNAKSVWMASPNELVDGTNDGGALNQQELAQLNGRSQAEIAALEALMRDARREVWESDQTRFLHILRWPIEFLWLRGPLNAVAYTNQTGQFGTDHPMIRFEVMRR